MRKTGSEFVAMRLRLPGFAPRPRQDRGPRRARRGRLRLVPPRGPRAQGRAGRRRRRPRRRRARPRRRLAARPAVVPPPRALPRGARRPRAGRPEARRRRRSAGHRRAAGDADRALGRHALRPRHPRPGDHAGARRVWWAREPALHERGAPGAAAGREGARRGGGRRRAAPQAARRRRAGRAPQRGQVVADLAADASAAEDRGLPVHDARAEPRHARGCRPPARGRRHPRADRGRERRRRPRPRLPRPRRAHAAAGPRAGPGAAGRLGSGSRTTR